jgi:inorganic pyrophosphatase/exopolyphosphatase
MVTDIAAQGTCLLVSGEEGRVERALGGDVGQKEELATTDGRNTGSGVVDLPGVMSRKKQLAPRLLELF